MYNLLIADDNLIYVKSLANEILSRTNFIKLIKIATDGDETYEYLNKEHIDLMILDLDMPKCSGLEVLKKIGNKGKNKLPKVIIVSGYLDKFNYREYFKYNVVGCYFKGMGTTTIAKNIINSIEVIEKENKIQLYSDKITKELINLKYNIKHNGTTYLKESIEYIIEKDNQFWVDNLEKNVYPYIAKLHKKTVGNIKNNIVKATNNMYMGCDMNYLIKYFSFCDDTKPTPKLVIATVINKISKCD